MERHIELTHLRLRARDQSTAVSRQLAILKACHPFLSELTTYASIAAQARFTAQFLQFLAEDPPPQLDTVLGAALRAAMRGLGEGQRALEALRQLALGQ